MRGFYFNTEEHTYFYNDINGTVKPVPQNRVNEFIFSKEVSENIDIQKATSEEIKENLLVNGLNQLTLIMTEECNIRCKYCIYSGIYENSRQHSNNYMSIETAKKCCDIYMKERSKSKNIRPLKTPIIGFYGGEPLLNFKVIKETVEYVNQTYGQVEYTISTNGVLLTDEIIEFLANNNFLTAISLNGDKKENDRMRVFADGSGTYDKVKTNLTRIKKLYPEYVSKCVLLCTVDPGTDMEDLEEFFTYGELSDFKIVRLSQVFNGFTNWYDQYNDETTGKYRMSIKKLREAYLQKLIENKDITYLDRALFGTEYRNLLNRNMNIESSKLKPSFIGKTGLCIPGSKIAVSPNGEFHMCERINNTRPIGDSEIGLDYDRIIKIIDEYNEKSKKCSVCPIERVCSTCYVENINLDGSFNEPNEDHCCNKRKHCMENFIEIYSAIEKGFEPNNII